MTKKKLKRSATHKLVGSKSTKRSWFRRHPLRTAALLIFFGGLLYMSLRVQSSPYLDLTLGQEATINAVSNRELKAQRRKAEEQAMREEDAARRMKKIAKEAAKKESNQPDGGKEGQACHTFFDRNPIKSIKRKEFTFTNATNESGSLRKLNCYCTETTVCKKAPNSGIRVFSGVWQTKGCDPNDLSQWTSTGSNNSLTCQ